MDPALLPARSPRSCCTRPALSSSTIPTSPGRPAPSWCPRSPSRYHPLVRRQDLHVQDPPGFRFSPPSNEPVTAQTFKDTIERTLNPGMHSVAAQFLSDVVGASAYMAGKAGHIAGVIANGDTLPSSCSRPSPDFLSRLALPASAPCRPTRPRPQRRAPYPFRRPLRRLLLTPVRELCSPATQLSRQSSASAFATIQVVF